MSIWAPRRISDVFWLDLTHFTRCCLRKTSRGPIVTGGGGSEQVSLLLWKSHLSKISELLVVALQDVKFCERC